MEDVTVYHNARDEQRERGIDAVSPSDETPGRAEGSGGLSTMLWILGLTFSTADGASGLIGGDELDDVCYEEMTGDKGVED